MRIRQAEVEFQLGREELNLMSLSEELRNLTTRLEIGNPPTPVVQANNQASLFGIVSECLPNPATAQAVLMAISVLYDPVNPCFGVSEQLLPLGVATVDWAREDSRLKTNDR